MEQNTRPSVNISFVQPTRNTFPFAWSNVTRFDNFRFTQDCSKKRARLPWTVNLDDPCIPNSIVKTYTVGANVINVMTKIRLNLIHWTDRGRLRLRKIRLQMDTVEIGTMGWHRI
jgi:hypothetical protein